VVLLTPKPKVFACLVLLATSCMAALPAKVSAGWQTYCSPDYGFTIDYPKNISFYSGHPDLLETQLSFIPICDDTTVACFQYNGKEYAGTNFEAAGLSVNVLRDMRTEQDCDKIDTGSDPIKTKIINGIKFHYGMTGEVATSKSKGGFAYRTFHESVCFEIAVAIAATDIGVFDPGTIETFDSAKLNRLLDKMVPTFKFASHIKDGPGWKVYDDGGCGGVYEYPEGETVRTTVEYSQAGYYSNEITCSQSFTHHGLDYTVAAKVNLRYESQLDSWLKSSGYPDLSEARIVVRSENFTEYNAGPYYYIFGQRVVYILNVSDAKHNVTIPHHDQVFTHLLDSFKAN
jgi:hypothetical protein